MLSMCLKALSGPQALWDIVASHNKVLISKVRQGHSFVLVVHLRILIIKNIDDQRKKTFSQYFNPLFCPQEKFGCNWTAKKREAEYQSFSQTGSKSEM